MKRSKLPVPLAPDLWEELRSTVDAKLPRRIQAEVYTFLEKVARDRSKEGKLWLGSLHYRPCDYGLIYLYFLLTKDGCRALEPLERSY